MVTIRLLLPHHSVLLDSLHQYQSLSEIQLHNSDQWVYHYYHLHNMYTVDPRLSGPHLSQSLFIQTHKFNCEHYYMFVNLIM